MRAESIGNGAAAGLAALALLLVPFMVNGGAGYFADIKPYVKGGFVAFESVRDVVSAPAAAIAAGASDGASAGLAGGAPEISGVRSIAYSIAAYLAALGGGYFSLLVLAQAVAACLLLSIFFRALDAPAWGVPLAVLLIPPISFGVGTASPDIWAGFVILSLLILGLTIEKIGPWARLAVAVVAGFGISAHSSHIPLALAALFAVALVLFLRSKTVLAAAKHFLWPAGAACLGIGVTMLTGLFGFGEVSVAPKRYPLTLARSIEDGPARWHLEEHCQDYNYVVCELYPDGPPRRVGQFLWGPEGVARVASAEQMEQLRREEVVILQRAIEDYPFFAFRQAVTNTLRQLKRFDLGTQNFRARIAYLGRGMVTVEPRSGPILDTYLTASGALWKASLAASLAAPLLAMMAGFRPRRLHLEAGFAILVSCLANAAICAIFSAPVDRYQVRVLWLLPALVFAALMPWVKSRYQAK